MEKVKRINYRIIAIALGVVLELLFIFTLLNFFYEKAAWIELVVRLLSVLIVLYIIRSSRHLSSAIVWIIMIILFPIPGTLAYLLIGADLFLSRTLRAILRETEKAKQYLTQNEDVYEKLTHEAAYHTGQFNYISHSAHFPVYVHTQVDYYPLGELGYEAILDALRKAESFIFLEYFIIEQGQMWDGMLDILAEKASQGVDVRVMYDDIGSFNTLPADYVKVLESKGIKAQTFNRINPIVNIIVNHRDHRKILVIDGKVGFTGGINLADEYINQKVRFGHWKDNCLRLEGDAVWNLTVLFLTNWHAIRGDDEDYLQFKVEHSVDSDGYVAPYGETPLSAELTAQNIYMTILNQANNYCYIMTPYLIIDTEMINALILCAKRGVDVCLMTPGIPDKKMVFSITRSYYQQLIEGGVKIFEYTPGFIHSKVFVSDDCMSVVGTINLDYRSLYLHFENGVFLFNASAVEKVRDDCLETMQKCHQVTLKETRTGFVKSLFLSALRLIAPLL